MFCVLHCLNLKKAEVTEYRKVFDTEKSLICITDLPISWILPPTIKEASEGMPGGVRRILKQKLAAVSLRSQATAQSGQTGSHTHLVDRIRFLNLYSRTDGYQVMETN